MISRLGRASGVGLKMGLAASPGAGCRAELAADAVQDAIAAWFSAEGISVDAVHCPRGLTQAAGESVECAATLGPEVVEVTARVVDDDGVLSLRPRHAPLDEDRDDARHEHDGGAP